MEIRRQPLNEQEETVMRLRTEEKLTQAQIAGRVGVSKGRVRQVLANARKNLKEFECKGEESLRLLPGRVRNFVEWYKLGDREEIKQAIRTRKLRWDEHWESVCLEPHRPRNIGWDSWVVLNEWAGLPPPQRQKMLKCPHCGREIEV